MINRTLVRLLLLLLLTATGAEAQPVGFELGEAARQVHAGSGAVLVPVMVRVPASEPEGLAAFQGAIRWDTAAISYDSLRIVRGTALTVTVNSQTAGAGLLRLSAFSPEAVTRSGAVLELFYTPRLTHGSTVLTLELEAAGDAMGRGMRDRVRTRGLELCVAPCAENGPRGKGGQAVTADRYRERSACPTGSLAAAGPAAPAARCTASRKHEVSR